MARIRTIKPEFWKHEDLSELPEFTHMLAAALLNHADDEGYFNANPALVKSECLPLRESSVSVQDSLTQLAGIGFIQLGRGDDGKRYGRVLKFAEHQRVNRPTPSKIKAVGIVWESSASPHAQLTEPSPPEGKGKEGKGREQGREPSASSPAEPVTTVADELDAKRQRQAQRLAAVTDAALTTFNASKLVKPNGGALATVSEKVGRENRQRQVQRCIAVARQICAEDYQSDHITDEFWRDYWAVAHADDFHSGRQRGGRGHENWLPDFEFLTRPATMLKLYDRAASEDAA